MAFLAGCVNKDPGSTRQKVFPLPALRRERPGKKATASSPGSDPSGRPGPAFLARAIAAQLEDDKAENILEIDLAGKSSMADAMVVASGRSQRHVSALADHVARRFKDEGVNGVRVEGLPNADWVLIDAGDVIVHIFRPEVREFYNLERLWGADAIAAARPPANTPGLGFDPGSDSETGSATDSDPDE